MTITNQIDEWIERHGSCRDALNVALAQIEANEATLRALEDVVTWEDCPICNGIIKEGYVCLNCGHDSTIGGRQE